MATTAQIFILTALLICLLLRPTAQMHVISIETCKPPPATEPTWAFPNYQKVPIAREIVRHRTIAIHCPSLTQAFTYNFLADHLCTPLIDPYYSWQASIEALFATNESYCPEGNFSSLGEQYLNKNVIDCTADCRVNKVDCCGDQAYLQCHTFWGAQLCTLVEDSTRFYNPLEEDPEVQFGVFISYDTLSGGHTKVLYDYRTSCKCNYYNSLENCTHFASLFLLLVLASLLPLSAIFCCVSCSLTAYQMIKTQKLTFLNHVAIN